VTFPEAVSEALFEEAERVIDMPIAEGGVTGATAGARRDHELRSASLEDAFLSHPADVAEAARYLVRY